MTIQFFGPWPLWGKMTFILGVAILIVFGIGYGKLMWTTRFIKKHRLLDEERRLRTQELRMSRQYVEAQKSQEIPFGIRAIQRGIQIDGIWISKPNSPIPSEQRVPSLSVDSCDPFPVSDSIQRNQASEIYSPVALDASSQGNLDFRQSVFKQGSNDPNFEDGHRNMETFDQADGRSRYQPRRSSRLRFGTYGEYHEESLDQLEGKTHVSHAENAQIAQVNQNSSKVNSEYALPFTHAYYNEMGEGSSSDESQSRPYSSITNKTELLNESISQLSQIKGFGSHIISTSTPKNTARKVFTAYRSNKGNSMDPHLKAEDKTRDPSATLPSTPLELQQNIEAPMELGYNESAESEVPLSPRMPCSSPFIPGELHVNRTVRKVNSGFEVLPAGTFGISPQSRDDNDIISLRQSFGSSMELKRPNKLQKKRIDSKTAGSSSSTYGTA